MATQIGTVSILIGTATATSADGTVRTLHIGDIIYADDLISTGPSAALEITFADGSLMDLGRSSQLVLDDAVYDPSVVAEAEVATDADAIQQAILAGVDPTQVTEATAAGAGAETGGNEGSDIVQVDYLAPSIIPDSGFDTTGISFEFDEVEEELPPLDDIPTLSINDVTVFEPTSSGEDGGGQQQAGSGGGAIFVTGHDSDEHSNIDYLNSGLDYLLFGQAATVGERTGNTIAVIGDGSSTGFVSGLESEGWTVTYYVDGDPDITDAFNADIVLVESGNDSSLNTQLIALTDNFADYINNGGALYIHTDEGGGQSWYNFVPSFGDTINASVGGTGVYAVTAAGSTIGLTEPIVDDDPTHSYYTGVDTSLFTIFEVADSEAVFGEDNGAAVAFGARNIGIDDGGFIPTGGSVFAEFTVSLSSVSTVDVLVDFVTANGTAISGGSGVAENDYGSTSGTVTIPAGSLTATIQVEIFGDDVTEITEQYFVTLGNPVNATIADGTGVGTILDNDLVEFSIEALSGSEGGQHSYVDEGDQASYTISYDGVLADGVQAAVTFDTASGTVVNFDAIEGVDFDESTNTVVFTGGSGITSVVVFVQTTDDLLIENNEDYSINLIASSANSTINPSADHVDTTILDDDFPIVSILPDTSGGGDIVEEGNALSYVVSLSAPGTSNAVVDLSFSGGTADNSTDYTPTFYSDAGLTSVITSLTFTPGQTVKTIYVGTSDNDPPLNEVNETVNVTVTASSGVTGTDEAVGTITDSDLPVVSILPDTSGGGDIVEEGNALSYVVSLSGASDQNAVVDLSFSGGTADNATDYTPTFYSDAGLTSVITSLTFTPGETAKTIYVGTADNDPPLNEVNETVNVTVTASSGVTGTDEAIGTITDSDLPVVSILPDTSGGGDIVEEGTALSYVVSLSGASDQNAVVDLSFSGGTADNATDYTPTFYSDAGLTSVITSLTFTPGETAKTIYVGTTDNDPPLNEVNETVNVTVTASSGVTGTDEAVGTITDSDLPVVSILPDTSGGGDIVEEGNALSYVVSLSGASDQNAVVDLSFSGGTADNATDYTPTFYSDAGLTSVITSLTFTPGQTVKTIYVGTADNDPPLNEVNETVNVTVTASSGVTGTDEAVGTITDSDLPVVSILPDTSGGGDIVEEGNALSYVVSLSGASDQNAVVDLSFSGGTADNATDYMPTFYSDAGLTSVITSLTFTPGQTAKTIYVGTADNDPPLNEVNETVNVTVTASSGVTGSDEAVGTITDSDLPVVSILPDTSGGGDIVEEGTALSYVVSLSDASDQNAVVDLSFSGGTADNATDYTPTFYSDAGLTSVITSLTFTPGETAKTIYVGTADNDPPLNEVNETVNVTVTASSGVTGTDEAIGTITDSDLPVVSILPDTSGGGDIVEEGTALSYVVSLSGASDQNAVVDLSFSGGTADNATDYTPTFYSDAGLTSVITSLTFTPGETAKTIYVGTTDNDPPLNEVNETVNVTVTASSGVTGTDEAVGTITDSDLPVVSILPDTSGGGDIVEEGTALSYVVSLSDASDQNAVVDLSFSGGTADNATDYTPTFYSDAGLTSVITSLTFTPGETAKTIYVGTADNDPPLNEVNETVNVTVTASSGVTGTDEAIGTITDSDLPVVSILPDTSGGGDIVEEGNALSYVVSLSGASDQNAVVDLSFSGGTADNATDYTPTFYSDAGLTSVITSLTFTPGETAKTIYVGTADNDPPLNEVNETVNVTVTASSGVTGTDEAIGTITDSDLPVVSILPDTSGGGDIVEEGTALSYVVSLSGASDQNAVVDLSFSGGTADNATDYTPTFYSDAGLTSVITSLTFTPGETAKTIYVGTTDNDPPLNEVNETVNVTVTASSGVTGTDEAVGTITDSDLPVVSILPDTSGGGDIVEEGNALSYVVSLSGASDQNAVVDLSFSGGTADNATDYMPTFYSDAGLTSVITSLTFTPGQTAKTIYVGTADNDPPLNEVNETVNVTVTASSGVTGTDEAIGTITDSDLPVVSISDAGSVPEGSVLAYTVSLSAVSDSAVNASLAFTGGDATSGTDYTAKFYSDAGLTTEITSVSFSAGDTADKTVYVGTLNNDPPYGEADETVDVSLQSISGATGGITTGTGTITEVDHTPEISDLTPKLEGGDVTVDEDDLLASRGAGESEGSDSTKESTTQLGTFTITSEDTVGDLTIAGNAVITNGVFAATSFTTALGNTLSVTGYNVGSGEVSYSYTLVDNTTNHGFADNGENSIYEDFSVLLTDSDGDEASDTLSVQIIDDVPSASPVVNEGDITQSGDTNLMLILDVSGSMGSASGIPGLSRLDVMIESSIKLLNKYDLFGEVKVNITTFASSASNISSGWVDVSTAKTLLLGLNDSGYTNYDAALNQAWNSFSEPGVIADAQAVSYFMSDGVPNRNSISGTGTAHSPLGGGDGINGSEETAWEGFLETNNIKSFALGMGNGVSAGNLNPIAYDGSDGVGFGDEMDAIIVTDFAQLNAVLAATVSVPVISGDLLDGVMPAETGADGGWVNSITVDGVTYIYNQQTDTESVSGGISNGSFDDVTNQWTVTTPEGAELTLDMDTGEYEYQPSNTLNSSTEEVFDYVIIDNDGDTAASTLTFSVEVAKFPSGLAYSIAGGLNSGNDQIDEVLGESGVSSKYLYAIDLEDGTTTQVGQIATTSTNVIGLSLNPDDGQLYGLTATGVIQVDPATAESILLLDDNTNVFGNSNPAGASFDTSGTYYIAADNEVWTISNIESHAPGTNFSTVTSTLFTLGGGAGNKIHGIATYSAGLVYYITESGGNSILKVFDDNLNTHTTLGTVTDGVDTPDINGLSFDNFGNLWGVDNQGDLVRISTDNGEVLGVVTQANSQVTAAGFFSLAIDVDDPSFLGTSSDDILGSTIGSDSLSGLAGDDVVFGNGGDDSLLSGGSGDDLIIGGSGNDTLSDGDDLDILSGGDGNDIFVMADDSDIDVISDFDATIDTDIDGTSTSEGADDIGSGVDTLDLSDLLTGLGVDGSNQDDFIELFDTGNSVEVRVDVSGSGTFSGDAEVVLQNFNTLNPSSTDSIKVSIDAANLNVDIS